MSYEGLVYYLCEGGHQAIIDCWESELYCCPVCNQPLEYRTTRDCTNGDDPDDPETLAPETELYEEYEETIVVKRQRFRPIGTRWRKLV